MSPVQQKGSDQFTYESFATVAPAADALLKKFIFLLASDRVVPPSGPCHLDELATASEKVGKELTREFYVRYANMRENAFEHLCSANPAVPPREVLVSTQSCSTASCSARSARTGGCSRPSRSSGPMSTSTPTRPGPSGRTSAACSARWTAAARR